MPSHKPRILFVTSEAVFIPRGNENGDFFTAADNGGFSSYLGRAVFELYNLGFDVCVAQPDYRRIFKNLSNRKPPPRARSIPANRVYLTKDRAFFYADYIFKNHSCDNLKISIFHQREVFNHVIPEFEPDLIHSHDWMTGMVPAMAKEIGIPCLFTVQNPTTAKSLLSFVEDKGIDAALFWEYLYYDRYPLNYRETRASNPINFLLSGIFSADYVFATNHVFLAKSKKKQGFLTKLPHWELLKTKSNAGCVAFNPKQVKTQAYIDIYMSMLQQHWPQYKSDNYPFDSVVQIFRE